MNYVFAATAGKTHGVHSSSVHCLADKLMAIMINCEKVIGHLIVPIVLISLVIASISIFEFVVLVTIHIETGIKLDPSIIMLGTMGCLTDDCEIVGSSRGDLEFDTSLTRSLGISYTWAIAIFPPDDSTVVLSRPL